MDTPLPLVTNPIISSPGTGLQHFENLTETSSIPATTIPFFDLIDARFDTLAPELAPDALLTAASISFSVV